MEPRASGTHSCLCAAVFRGLYSSHVLLKEILLKDRLKIVLCSSILHASRYSSHKVVVCGLHQFSKAIQSNNAAFTVHSALLTELGLFKTSIHRQFVYGYHLRAAADDLYIYGRDDLIDGFALRQTR